MSQPQPRSEAGIASILVTMIIIIITSLIVLGFAQSARRNQRQALDRQVSTQAYYAAETGVNDAVTAIKAQLPGTVAAKTTCDSTSAGAPYVTTLSDARSTIGPDTKYSCLLINPNPKSLQYSLISQGKSTIVPVNTPATMGSMTLSWQANGGESRNPADCDDSVNRLPKQTAWGCDYGLLRVDLTKYGSDYTATTLAANTTTFYLKPDTSGPVVSVPTLADPAKRAYIQSTGCVQSTATCKATIRFTGDQQSKYYMRVTSMYRDSSQLIVQAADTTGKTQTLNGVQAIIDSTGKSQDQLRRISVRVALQNLSDSDTLPTNALQTSGAICKRFTIGEYLAASPANLCAP